MVERAAREERRNWGVPLNVVVGASIALLSMTVYSPFGDILYLLFVAPPVGLFGFVLVLVAVINRKRRQALAMLLTLVAFLAVSGASLKNEPALHCSLRWLLWSPRCKADVLAQGAHRMGGDWVRWSLPCKVPWVGHLERQWYCFQF